LIGIKYAEKQKEAAAAAASAEKDKADLNLKISELGAALKAAAAKEAKFMSSSKMSNASEEDKNKTIAQQSLKISQLESTLRQMDANFKTVESSTASLKLSVKVIYMAVIYDIVEQLICEQLLCCVLFVAFHRCHNRWNHYHVRSRVTGIHWHSQMLESQKSQREEELKTLIADHDVELQDVKRQLKVMK
jgi:hypothetical protein